MNVTSTFDSSAVEAQFLSNDKPQNKRLVNNAALKGRLHILEVAIDLKMPIGPEALLNAGIRRHDTCFKYLLDNGVKYREIHEKTSEFLSKCTLKTLKEFNKKYPNAFNKSFCFEENEDDYFLTSTHAVCHIILDKNQKRGAKKLEYLIRMNRHVKRITENVNLLDFAVRNNRPRCIKTLIDKGTDVNEVNEKGKTPLYLASELGKIACVKVLIENKADVNSVKKLLFLQKKTPLDIACSNKEKLVMEILRDAGGKKYRELK